MVPQKSLRLKKLDRLSILPKLQRQTVKCLSKIDKLPALFEMEYTDVDPMKMSEFENIAKNISSNQKMTKIEDTVWQSLCIRATSKTGNINLLLILNFIRSRFLFEYLLKTHLE